MLTMKRIKGLSVRLSSSVTQLRKLAYVPQDFQHESGTYQSIPVVSSLNTLAKIQDQNSSEQPISLDTVKEELTRTLRRASSLFDQQNTVRINIIQLHQLLEQCLRQQLLDQQLFRMIVSLVKTSISNDQKMDSVEINCVFSMFSLLQQINLVDKKLLGLLGKFAEKQGLELSTQQTSIMVDIFRRTGITNEVLLCECERTLARHCDKFAFNQFSQAFRDYSIFAESYNVELCELFSDQFKRQKEQLTPTCISQIVEGQWNFRHRDDEILDKCVKQLIQQNNSEIECLQSVVQSMCKLGYFDEEFFDFVIEQVMLHKDKLGVKNFCELLWSMAVGNYWPPEVWAQFIQQLQNEEKQGDLLEYQFKKLYQCHLLMNEQQRQEMWEMIPKSLREYCKHLWITQKDSKQSFVQQEIFKGLKRLGYRCQIEYIIPSNTFIVDINIVMDQQKFAIEVDGPKHFTNNKPYRAIGNTISRNKLLENQGYQVISIPFYEYENFYRSKDQLMKFLEQKLTDQLVYVAQLR